MNKPKIKLDFNGFWPGFNKQDNYFYKLLSQHYDIELTNNPDFLIYSGFDKRKTHRKYKCVKIYYTGENRRPDYNECDYSFTFDYIEQPNHYRLPLYAMYGDVNKIIKTPDYNIDSIIKGKTKFCAFVVSSPTCVKRNNIFHKLSHYKQVDSGGKLLNNVGGPVKNKLEFLRPYKFVIAYENSSYPGYTTEKIFEPMLVNGIPIYWGNPLIERDFNLRSFVNAHDFQSEEKMIERIIEIDKNQELYRSYLNQPYFNNNEVNRFVKPENVLKQFEHIFNNAITPVAQKKKKFFFF